MGVKSMSLNLSPPVKTSHPLFSSKPLGELAWEVSLGKVVARNNDCLVLKLVHRFFYELFTNMDIVVGISVSI